VGDEYFDGPQIYVQYETVSPFVGLMRYIKRVNVCSAGFYPKDEARILKFDTSLRREASV
jgi:hypothetical protein